MRTPDEGCIEANGVQHRDDPDVRAVDLVRQRALEDAGWTVIRIRSWCFASDVADALRVSRGDDISSIGDQ